MRFGEAIIDFHRLARGRECFRNIILRRRPGIDRDDGMRVTEAGIRQGIVRIQIDGLLEEIVDRFGKLPPQAQTLIDVHRLRVLARPYGVTKVDAAPGVIHITFKANPPIDSMRIIEMVQKNKHIKLAGNEKLRIERELKDPKDRAQMVRDVLRSLGQPKVAEPA